MAIRYFLTIPLGSSVVPRSWRRRLAVKWAFRCRLPHWPRFNRPVAVRDRRFFRLLLVLCFLAMTGSAAARHAGGGFAGGGGEPRTVPAWGPSVPGDGNRPGGRFRDRCL